MDMEMMSNSDDEAKSDFPHRFVIGPAQLQAAQAAASDFLSCSTERSEAISTLVKLPPAVMASILLANIPFNDSMDGQATNKIFEALDYVKAGIQHRAKHQGVFFCKGNVKLPEETFVHILGFLDKRDLIDNVSHVSYAWAKASLSPNIRRWQTIDFYKPPTNMGGFELINTTEITTRKLLLQMIQRPQFARLKKLVVHFKLTDSLIEEIAEACPRLEELTDSYGGTICNVSSETLCKLPTLFPALNTIGLEMKTSSNMEDVISLVKTIGTRLVGLRVEASLNLESGFTDDDFVIIGRHCPNLRSFNYWSYKSNPHFHSVMTERGLAALIDGCPKLESLCLFGTCRLLGLEAFGYIALHAKNLRILNVSGNWTGWNNDEAIRKYFAKRLTHIVNYESFHYRLLPLP